MPGFGRLGSPRRETISKLGRFPELLLELGDRSPADIPPHFSRSVAQVSRVNVPVLLLVEEDDEMGSLGAVNVLDQALRNHEKEVHTIRYNRGGGHLFIGKDYWLDDVRAFLHEKLL